MKSVILICLCSSWVSLWSQSEKLYHEILSDPCFAHATIGMLVVDLTSGKEVIEFNSDLALPPASLLKVFTTWAGLKVLGSQFQFETELGYQGNIVDGVLSGDLIVRGYGDPTVGSRYLSMAEFDKFLTRVVESVRESNIRVIEGNILGDGHSLSRLAAGSSWPYKDLANYYGAGAFGLNAHDNLFYIRFKQARPGMPTKIESIYPEVPGLTVENFVSAGPEGSGDEAYVFGSPFQESIMIYGTIPPGSRTFTIKGALPDPAKFMASQLKTRLISSEIGVGGEAKSIYVKPAGAFNVIATFKSPPLLEVSRITNQHSVNLYAEAIGKYLELRLAEERAHEPVLQYFYRTEGIDISGCRFTDYSGLAPDNAVTSRGMVDLLRQIHADRESYRLIESTMSVAGVSGTMRNMLRGTKAAGNIKAKSGLIEGSRNYAGYINSEDGREYAFCVLTYNANCARQVLLSKLEDLMESMYLSLE